MARMSRWDQREHDPVEVHLRLLDNDVDSFDDRISSTETRQAKMFWLIFAATLSTATAMVLLAINLVVVTR